MKIFAKTIAFGLLTLMVALSASAAPKKRAKTRHPLETYPALEEIELAPEATPSEIHVARTEVVTTTTSPIESAARTRGIEERLNLLEKRYLERATSDAMSPPSSSRSTSASFEKVPTNKTNMIAARLKLVEEILLESGRAYDYRTLTSSQLRQVLVEIRRQKSKTVKDLSDTLLAE